jgi:RecB family endonuclease NucS
VQDDKPSGTFGPAPVQLLEAINKVAMGMTVMITGVTEVQYDGRASSKAARARRLLILKPDGSMIIHSGRNNRPVNWQPPGTSVKASVLDTGEFVVEGTRSKPKERLSVRFYEVSMIAAAPLTDGKDDFEIEGTEDEMVAYVKRNPEVIEKGFQPLEREAKTDYGSADLIGRLANGSLLVLEFKRAKAQLSSVSQLERYVSYFRSREEKVVGGIVAPDITKQAKKLLGSFGFRFYRMPPGTRT